MLRLRELFAVEDLAQQCQLLLLLLLLDARCHERVVCTALLRGVHVFYSIVGLGSVLAEQTEASAAT